MAIQMILCLETNKKANTDYIYIKETIDFLYQKNNQIKISPLYMSTKTKYKSGDIIREIAKKKKDLRRLGRLRLSIVLIQMNLRRMLNMRMRFRISDNTAKQRVMS